MDRPEFQFIRSSLGDDLIVHFPTKSGITEIATHILFNENFYPHQNGNEYRAKYGDAMAGQ